MSHKKRAGHSPAEKTKSKIIVMVGKLENEVAKIQDPPGRLQLLLSCMHLRKEVDHYL